MKTNPTRRERRRLKREEDRRVAELADALHRRQGRPEFSPLNIPPLLLLWGTLAVAGLLLLVLWGAR